METSAVETQQTQGEWPVTELESRGELICLIRGDVININGRRTMVYENDQRTKTLVVVRGGRLGIVGEKRLEVVEEQTFSYNELVISARGLVNRDPPFSHITYTTVFEDRLGQELTVRGLL